jgi:hypothetical protein
MLGFTLETCAFSISWEFSIWLAMIKATSAELVRTLCSRGRLREGAESYAKALASDILR